MLTLESSLSPKHFKIVSLIARGMKNADVAREIGTTENMVKNYLHIIYDEVGLWNRVELAMRFVHEAERGLYSVGHGILAAANVPFTVRERQIIYLLMTGADNVTIGQDLFIRPRTVKAHFQRLFLRFGIETGYKRVKLATSLYILHYRLGVDMVPCRVGKYQHSPYGENVGGVESFLAGRMRPTPLNSVL
jgi:DNA-binding NarL/FixJ family response regulator